MKVTTHKDRKVSPSGAAEELAHLALLVRKSGGVKMGAKGLKAPPRNVGAGVAVSLGSEPPNALVFRIKRRPKGLPSEGGVLAFVDEETLSVQVVSREERTALKAQFRQTAPELTASEEEALRRGGASAAELRMGPAIWALARGSSEVKYQALLQTSLDVERAAKRLGVTGGRVRQLLGGRRLYGVKVGGDWRIPLFQFLGKGLVPGLEAIVARMRPDVGLLAVYTWFTTRNADLRTAAEEDEGFTPLAWLRSGHPPEDAASLAEGL